MALGVILIRNHGCVNRSLLSFVVYMCGIRLIIFPQPYPWGRGRLCTCRYTVTTRMIPALKWAAMRAILMFIDCEGQSHTIVSTDHNFLREKRAEAVSNRGPSAYQPNALPLGQTGSHSVQYELSSFFKLCFDRCYNI